MKIASTPNTLAQPLRVARPQLQAPKETAPADQVELSSPAKRDLGKQATVAANTVAAATSSPIVAAPLRVVLIGAPGSGKGTQADVLEHAFGVPHLSTGEILREEVKQGTELGKQAHQYMLAGKLVPDELMLDIVQQRLEKLDGFVLDGFPRSLGQAQKLDEMLQKPLTCVAMLEISDETIFKRLKERGREDDTDETIRERIKVFHEQTEPAIAHYEKKGVLERIPGEGSIPEVASLLVRRLTPLVFDGVEKPIFDI